MCQIIRILHCPFYQGNDPKHKSYLVRKYIGIIIMLCMCLKRPAITKYKSYLSFLSLYIFTSAHCVNSNVYYERKRLEDLQGQRIVHLIHCIEIPWWTYYYVKVGHVNADERRWRQGTGNVTLNDRQRSKSRRDRI